MPRGGVPPEETRFEKGKSGNPGGRTPVKWLRELLDAARDKTPGGVTNRQAIGMHLIEVATSYEVVIKGQGENAIPMASAKDAIAAATLLMAYDMGKPVDPVAITDPEGNEPKTTIVNPLEAMVWGLIKKSEAAKAEGNAEAEAEATTSAPE